MKETRVAVGFAPGLKVEQKDWSTGATRSAPGRVYPFRGNSPLEHVAGPRTCQDGAGQRVRLPVLKQPPLWPGGQWLRPLSGPWPGRPHGLPRSSL